MKIEKCVQFFQRNKIKIAFIAGGIILLFVTIHFFSRIGSDRRVFLYPLSGSSKIKKEVRYLNSHPVQGKINYYVDELILGPSFYRGRSLFTPGTAVEYCFLSEKTLYVGLSQEAVLQENGAQKLSEGLALLKKNIKKNFTGIKDIEVFIDGNCVSD